MLELPLSKSSLYTTITASLLLSSLANLSLTFCTTLENVYFYIKRNGRLIMTYQTLQHIKSSGFTVLQIKSDFFSPPVIWYNPRTHLLYMLFLSSPSLIITVLCCRWNVLFIIQSPTSTQRARQTRPPSVTAASGWDSENNQPVRL